MDSGRRKAAGKEATAGNAINGAAKFAGGVAKFAEVGVRQDLPESAAKFAAGIGKVCYTPQQSLLACLGSLRKVLRRRWLQRRCSYGEKVRKRMPPLGAGHQKGGKQDEQYRSADGGTGEVFGRSEKKLYRRAEGMFASPEEIDIS
jgi:hypothetical protein